MGKQNNRTCVICGKKYSYCPNCGADANKPTWYFVFCGENCKDIYNICTDWRDGIITKEEASEKISKLDISNISDFADATKKQIEELTRIENNTTNSKGNNTEKNIVNDTKSKIKK